MRSFRLLSLALITFLFSYPPATQAQNSYGHGKLRARYHHANKPSDEQHKRDTNVGFTYFIDGQGACGVVNSPNDFIVALNAAEYGDGAHCFEMITINIDGKTAQAQITDKCLGCSVGDLDLSQGLFEYFAPLSEGELHGSWYYNSNATTSSPTPVPPTTSDASSPTAVATTTFLSSSVAVSAMITTASVSTVAPSQTSYTPAVPTSVLQDSQTTAQINLALLELGVLLGVSFRLEN